VLQQAKIRYAWVLNLDAELEMASASYQRSPRVAQQQATFGAAARALLAPDDCLLSELAPVDASKYRGRAWCWTPQALALMAAAKVQPEPHPDTEVVKRVNHRLFAHELGGGLPGQAFVTDRESLEHYLRDTKRPWLCKRPFAFAGRGQMRFFGTVDEVQSNWIDASLRAHGLIVEPLVEILCEFSLHGYLSLDGTHTLGHLCVQSTNDRGVFREIRRVDDGDLSTQEKDILLQQGERVARALQAAGYFGPFGIDSYRYRDGSVVAICACSEINARYTMGFATGFGVGDLAPVQGL
jgi:ATP-grasp domain